MSKSIKQSDVMPYVFKRKHLTYDEAKKNIGKNPNFFNTIGGTEVIFVRAGPGNRAYQEGLRGKCEESFKPTDAPTAETAVIQRDTARYLNTVLRLFHKKFAEPSKTTLDNIARIYHDGTPKAVASFNTIKDNLTVDFIDGMLHKPDDVNTDDWFEKDGWNNSDINVVRRLVIIGSTTTMYNILAMAKAKIQRVRMAAGAIIHFAFPFGAEPSVTLGCGPHSENALLWANASEKEFETYMSECDKLS